VRHRLERILRAALHHRDLAAAEHRDAWRGRRRQRRQRRGEIARGAIEDRSGDAQRVRRRIEARRQRIPGEQQDREPTEHEHDAAVSVARAEESRTQSAPRWRGDARSSGRR
jgi:hypothetical protein